MNKKLSPETVGIIIEALIDYRKWFDEDEEQSYLYEEISRALKEMESY